MLEEQPLGIVVDAHFARLALRNLAALIINSLASFIGGIITARMLGPAGKGLLTVILLYPGLLFTIGHFSVYRAITVNIERNKYSFSSFPGSSLFFSLAVSFILTVIFFTVFLMRKTLFIQEVSPAWIMSALAILPCSMVVQMFSSILQAKGRLKQYNQLFIIQGAGVLFFIILLLMILKSGFPGAVVAYIMGNFIAVIFALRFVREIETGPWSVNFSLIKELVFDGARLHVGVIGSFIILKFGMFMLGYYQQAAKLGYYSVASSMSDMLILIPLAVQCVFYSKLPAMVNDRKALLKSTTLVYKYSLLPSLLFAFCAAAVAAPAVRIIYGRSFLPSIPVFLLLLPGVWFFWQSNILVYYLIGTKRFWLISGLSIFFAFLNIGLNYVFIPAYGAIGAALASLLSYLVVGIVDTIVFLKIAEVRLIDFIGEIAFAKSDIVFLISLAKGIFRR